jgi:O-antigen biosynthesis protein
MKDRTRKRVLFIDDRVPHAWLGSGFPRARTVLQTLLRQGCFVTFYPLTRFEEDLTSVYQDMPREIEFIVGYGPTLLEMFLRNRPHYYDAIFISRPHNMILFKPLVDAHPDWFLDTSIIYDAEAIFVTREVTLRKLMGTPLTAGEAEALLQKEINLASAADCVAAVSEPDAEQFRKHGIEVVRMLGHAISPAPTPRGFDQRKGFLFVGAIHEEASPNGDSVIWFLQEIFPKIQAELGPDIPFTVVGVNKSGLITQLAGPSVRLSGHSAGLTEFYDSARIFVAPTRYAAGIPHKVHEAAARGIPIVATPLLASQLGWRDGDPFLVGGDADTFARKCVDLYRNRDLWEGLRESAIERVREDCSIENFEAAVKDCLAAAKGRVAQLPS